MEGNLNEAKSTRSVYDAENPAPSKPAPKAEPHPEAAQSLSRSVALSTTQLRARRRRSSSEPIRPFQRLLRPFFKRVYLITTLLILHAMIQMTIIQLIDPNLHNFCHSVMLMAALGLILYVVYINVTDLHKHPWDWMFSIFIAVCFTYAVALAIVPSNICYQMCTGLLAYLVLFAFVACGRFVPKTQFTYYNFLAMLTGIFTVSLLIVALCIRMALDFDDYEKCLVVCWLLIFIFPVVVFQSQIIHGKADNRIPKKELPLICLVLFIDFIAIFMTFYWSPQMAEAQRFRHKTPK